MFFWLFYKIRFRWYLKKYVVRTLQIWNKKYISDKNGNVINDLLSLFKNKIPSKWVFFCSV